MDAHTLHYLDNAATEPVLPQAANVAFNTMLENFGNPSSLHRIGTRAAEILQRARCELASAVGCDPREIFFTSGGTESINTALLGLCSKHKSKFRHIVSTSIEHDATLQVIKKLEASGFCSCLVPPDSAGQISCRDILAAVRNDTLVVSVMGVNNETGAILPVAEIARGLKNINSHAFLHADMVQAFCKTDCALASCGADIISISGHKIGAPKGVGALYIKNGIKIPSFIIGGGQEHGFRSGTENLPAIAAFAEACRIRRQNFERDFRHVAALNKYAREKTAALVPEPVFISSEKNAPHILALSLPRARSEVILRVLSDCGVFVSAGSACSRGKRSHVLSQMKLSTQIIDGAIRLSFCPENTTDDIDAFAAAFAKAAQMLL